MTTSNRLLTEPQVRIILESPLPARKLGPIMGISPSAVTRVRNGIGYQDLAPDTPRPGKAYVPKRVPSDSNCKRCIHWLNGCTLSFPEATYNTNFAKTCAVYSIANPTDDDYC